MSRATAWTQDILQWEPWVTPVSDEALRDEQGTVLATLTAAQRKNPYYRVLVHEPTVLRHRTALFDAALKGDAIVSRADRELAAVGSSRATGCVYCASVHARAYSGLTRDKTMVQQVLDVGTDAGIPNRERGIVQFSAKLALEPAGLTAGDLQPLREEGFSDEAILDLACAAGIFANANRLMLTLGEGVTSTSGPT